MKVRCINNDGNGEFLSLTLGKVYDVLNENEACYTIIGDEDAQWTLFKDRFEVAEGSITSDAYVAGHGLHCPYCGSAKIETSFLTDNGSDTSDREVECNDCNKSWRELYKLAGYEEL